MKLPTSSAVRIFLTLVTLFFASLAQADIDGDGVVANDNCTRVANPDQRDTDRDGYGNRCDGDLNNDGFVNFADVALFNQIKSFNPDADFDGNNLFNSADRTIFKSLFGKAPGPSAVAFWARPHLAKLQPAFPSLTFMQPVAMVQAPHSNDRWYVAEKPGRLVSFANTALATTQTTFIDLSAQVDDRSEGGLLGVAFHPDYATNGYVFLSYTTSDVPSDPTSANLRSVISRFTANGPRTALDASSELKLMTVAQPYGNHKGGGIAFGPDGFLYIGFGDGGGGGDPQGHGQDTRTLLGAMLRIDVNVSNNDLSKGMRYKIPTGNPFSGSPVCTGGICPNQAFANNAERCSGSGCPEIFAWGLRNPWRWSFDTGTGDLWAGDVGESDWEEVDLIQVGKNYGWRCYEGTHDFNTSGCGATSNYTPPVTEYGHSEGHSITGGFVYRGKAIPALSGAYIFGDYISGNIWALADPKGAATRQWLLKTDMRIASFAQGIDGELYVLRLFGPGAIYKIVHGE